MATFACPSRAALEAALLFLSKQPADLGLLLRRILGDDRVDALARSTGRKKSGVLDPAALLAEILGVDVKFRKRVVGELRSNWQAWQAIDEPQECRSANQTAAEYLVANQMDAWQKLAELLAEGAEAWPSAQTTPSRGAARQPAHEAERKSSSPETEEPAESREAALREQLRAARQELASLQLQLSQERKDHSSAQDAAQVARLEAEQERKRATDWKQQLGSATEASARESALAERLASIEHELQVERQKVQLLSHESEDLRAVLADYDRFDESAHEDVPSFRDRPLTAAEQDLVVALEQRKHDGRASFHVLIVGGGPPQHRHKSKLLEYAEVLGFVTDWRMAEYQSWHRAISGLQRDMQERFDALIILHWNRTTFTRHAREICDVGKAKPCLTCHYEGFTNLRESLQECLRQLIAGEQRG